LDQEHIPYALIAVWLGIKLYYAPRKWHLWVILAAVFVLAAAFFDWRFESVWIAGAIAVAVLMTAATLIEAFIAKPDASDDR